MKRTVRDIFMSVCTFSSLIILTGSVVYAQNFAGIVPAETKKGTSADSSEQGESYSSVSVVPSNPTRGTIGALKLRDSSSSYTLGENDVIEISVLRHLEVSGEYVINSEGKIQYEFIGDIKIEGMKKDEVKELLTELLSEYIISPEVTIKIIGYNSKIVYVIGEVASPGKIYMSGDTITVREALILAGLPLLSGKVTQSRLITPSDTGKPDRKIVNVHKLLYEGDLRENLVMSPGDTLYVPPTVMAKALRVIQPVTQPINAAGSTGRKVYTGGF